MKRKQNNSLFISIFVSLVLFLLVALPGLAGASDDYVLQSSSTLDPGELATFTPTNEIYLPSLTPTVWITETATITYTEETPADTPSPTSNSSPTSTISPTPQPNADLDPAATQVLYFPSISYHIFDPTVETVLFCDDLSQALPIPDDNVNGVNDTIAIQDGRVLVSARLYLDISHSWVGDLVVKLAHQGTGKTITVLDRPGPSPDFCSNDDVVAILDDAAAQPVDDKCASYPHAISGIYLPTDSLEIFSAEAVAGDWRLNVSDRFLHDYGALNHWCLEARLANAMPAPTPTPPPVNLPSSASVGAMSGQDQQLELDCESRTAVDWAKHFGSSIGEIDFLNHLPTSDDPEAGFVGNPNGNWGYMPPNDYGVHASPIAALLRNYGLDAQAYHSLSWDDLRSEISDGDPAIVWIIGGTNYNLVNGTPHYYTASSTGNTTIVAKYEHTVILTGYTPSTVTILNGSQKVTIDLDQFLDSWSALDFMAVLARP